VARRSALRRREVLPHCIDPARNAGRAQPRIVCSLPVAVTSDPAAARRAVDASLADSAALPVYARTLAAQGAVKPSDVALLGAETELRSELRRLEALGVTDLNALLVPIPEDPNCARRTLDLLLD
jgi:hypothetical protein